MGHTPAFYLAECGRGDGCECDPLRSGCQLARLVLAELPLAERSGEKGMKMNERLEEQNGRSEGDLSGVSLLSQSTEPWGLKAVNNQIQCKLVGRYQCELIGRWRCELIGRWWCELIG